MIMWLGSLRVIVPDGFSVRGNLQVGLARWGVRMTRGCVRWIVILLGVGDGPCGDLEDGHQETEGVPLEGRCGNALPRHMLPLTD